jgi:GNAT superfamily N-acetyltransferase
MNRHIAIAAENDLPALHAILTLCGEYMHRKQGMSHWYPFRSFEIFKPEVAEAEVYAIYEDDLLTGTFYLTPKARAWYSTVNWANPEAKALYFGGFGILPFSQGRGLGAWVMNEIDMLTSTSGYEALRFDGVANNEPLMRFYEKLGYEKRGILETPRSATMCFEKIFSKL